MYALRIQRLFFLLLSVAFVLCKVYILLAYISIYYLSFEYLNSNKKYLELAAHSIYNWLFIAYLAFIVFVRGHLFHFSAMADYNLNTAEHLFFAFLICQTMLVYMEIFNLLPGKYILKLFTVFGLLNLIGILNEYFQNCYHHFPIFKLESDDLKDLMINLIGTSLFVIVSSLYRLKKSI